MSEKPPSWMESYSMPLLPAGEKLVRLTGLSEGRKKEAWQSITRNHPALARLLQEAELKSVMKAFDADLYVDASVVPSLPVEPLKGRRREAD
ncbi:hypothetical protein ACSVIJ_04060 [Pseudomonas sp. NCHU5208]|uniref:hypothetical protein n=1 Tax=unclassified Pseudomonas TaxID=196821 RepID=UPI003F980951